MAAAYRPIREFLAAEKKAKEGGGPAPPAKLRPIEQEDFKVCMAQVGPSNPSNSVSMSELRQWNETFGEGGSRKNDALTYFM